MTQNTYIPFYVNVDRYSNTHMQKNFMKHKRKKKKERKGKGKEEDRHL
jgi:hypothetical protein